ncbi:MAG: M50 family metallopeptidase, partial [Chthoniobacteraceae bacterium]|nr:M50 family metallopeptidase [Chthoniobacteraceae bacterium]
TQQPRKGWQRAGLREVPIHPALPTQIKRVEPGTPAAEAGLLPGDTVAYVNGQRIFTPAILALTIEKTPDQPVHLTLERGSQWLNFSIQPRPLPSEEGKQRPRIGIEWDSKVTLAHPTPTQQIVDSATAIVNMIDALVSPKSDVKAQHFSGPVGIGRIYYAMFQSEHGWRMALAFSVFFNVNLALLNLLPFPVLDGGHIVIAVIESIRRKPVNLRVLETVQSACALLLIGFILYVTFFDVQDFPWRKLLREKEVPAQTGK